MKPTSSNSAIIELIVFTIDEFSKLYGLSYKQAYNYLALHGGISFLEKHYQVEHTLSIKEVLSDVTQICNNKGGLLK